MVVVSYAGIWTVERRRLLSGTLWIIAGYGRVTLIRTIGGAVDRDPRDPYRSIWWLTRVVGETTGPWRLSPLRQQRRSCWSRCSDGCFPPQWCRHRHRLPNQYLRIWNSCYNGYWVGLAAEFASCESVTGFSDTAGPRTSGLDYGVVFLVWQNRSWGDLWMCRFRFCCRDGRRRRWGADTL